jgi:PKD repeat protein
MVDAKKYDSALDTIYYTVKNCNTVSFSSTACCSENYLWLFGDGDTSHQKEAEHIYSSFGSYIVKLVLDNSDTIYVDLNLNNEGVTLTGPDSICNASVPYVYQATGNFSSYAIYTWEIDSGTLFTDPVQKYLSYADFTGFPAKIKVHVTDPKTECESSDSMVIVYYYDMDNNSIHGSDSLIYCNNETGNFNITGTTPMGGNGQYNYQWLISYNNNNWTMLSGKTSKDLTAMTVDTICYMRSYVESNGCEILSNTVKIIPRIVNKKAELLLTP